MNNQVFLQGLGLAGYRSFATEELQRVGPMSKVHLVAGPNNSGKSNILTLVQRALPSIRTRGGFEVSGIDFPLATPQADRRIRLAVGRAISAPELAEISGLQEHEAQSLYELLQGPSFTGNDLMWFEFEWVGGRDGMDNWRSSREQVEEVTEAGAMRVNGPNATVLGHLSMRLTQRSGGQRGDDAVRVLDDIIRRLEIRTRLPEVATLSAFRQIGPDRDGVGGHDGPGLITRLAELQHPTFDRLEERQRFAAINRFVQTLFDDNGAAIEIPHDRETILIQHQGQSLPLENYGTGLHQVVILAAASTVLTGHLVCIEEPEVHLHPTLQRKFLRYITENTENQYLIATHSAHMLDADRASISAVRLEDARTRVAPALDPAELALVTDELGFRASDLVQANAVVWVEGPSDRVYLKHWLHMEDPDLIEGIHYVIMFYGGSMLMHLSPEDPAVEEFVNLPRMNRNFAIVIDSDRRRARAALSQAKRRIRRAIESQENANTMVWITRGYTIENYVPAEILKAAVSSVYPKATTRWAGDLYVNPLSRVSISGRSSAIDKTAVAHAAATGWGNEARWPHDLRRRVRELAGLIRRANADVVVDIPE